MYFRELPEPLLTYQAFDSFIAVGGLLQPKKFTTKKKKILKNCFRNYRRKRND